MLPFRNGRLGNKTRAAFFLLLPTEEKSWGCVVGRRAGAGEITNPRVSGAAPKFEADTFHGTVL